MSVEAMTLALHHSKSEGTGKLILIGIANHDGDGGSWPSIATLAKYAGVTERTVQKHIAELIELGEVERILNDGGTHKTPNHMRPNLYKILLKCPPECDGTTNHRMDQVPPVTDDTPRHQRHLPPVTDDTPPVSPVTPEPSLETSSNLHSLQDTTSTSPAIPPEASHYLTRADIELAQPVLDQAGLDLREVITHFNESKYSQAGSQAEWFQHWVRIEATCKREGKPLPGIITIPTPKDIDEAFQMFWDAYPKKERRPIALAAFKAAVKKEHPVTIIKGAMGYARKMERDHKDDQFVAAPSNWLNDERWTDKYPEPIRDLSRTAADY